jgi:hypothetical protein
LDKKINSSDLAIYSSASQDNKISFFGY